MKKYDMEYLIKAYSYSKYNEIELSEDEEPCGCFSCCSIFRPYEIKSFILEEGTAICPYCYADAIIGSYSGFPITREFLEAMNKQWFDGNKEIDWGLLGI